MPRGGKRPGAGRPKGSKDKVASPRGLKRIEKEIAREILRDQVKAALPAMTEAQIKNAQGISYLVYREKKGGKFTKVKADEAEAILERDDVIVEVWEERPSVQAFTDLLNRTLDKPAETLNATVQVTNIPERLIAARKRLGQHS